MIPTQCCTNKHLKYVNKANSHFSRKTRLYLPTQMKLYDNTKVEREKKKNTLIRHFYTRLENLFDKTPAGTLEKLPHIDRITVHTNTPPDPRIEYKSAECEFLSRVEGNFKTTVKNLGQNGKKTRRTQWNTYIRQILQHRVLSSPRVKISYLKPRMKNYQSVVIA